jgi:D-arabinose 1-dehydrogenase-like Zn-dependent alcohol dehydrogenase
MLLNITVRVNRNMQAIVFDKDLNLSNIPPPPIPEGWVLGKVQAAMISFIDKALISGLLPLPERRVIGSFGIIRVVKEGVNSPGCSGGIYGVKAKCGNHLIGLTTDGLMAEYVAIPTECLVEVKDQDMDPTFIPLYIEFSFINDLMRYTDTGLKCLILGCSFTSLVIALNLRRISDVTVACKDGNLIRKLSESGIQVSTIRRVKRNYFDLIVLADYNPYYIISSISYLNHRGILYIPPHFPNILPSIPLNVTKVEIVRGEYGSPRDGHKLMKEVPNKMLNDYIAITQKFEDVIPLLKYYSRVVLLKA